MCPEITAGVSNSLSENAPVCHVVTRAVWRFCALLSLIAVRWALLVVCWWRHQYWRGHASRSLRSTAMTTARSPTRRRRGRRDHAKVTGPERVAKAMDTLSITTFNSKSLKKLRVNLEVDVVIHGAVTRRSKKHLELTLSGKGKQKETLELDFKTTKALKKELAAKLGKKLDDAAGGGNDDDGRRRRRRPQGRGSAQGKGRRGAQEARRRRAAEEGRRRARRHAEARDDDDRPTASTRRRRPPQQARRRRPPTQAHRRTPTSASAATTTMTTGSRKGAAITATTTTTTHRRATRSRRPRCGSTPAARSPAAR